MDTSGSMLDEAVAVQENINAFSQQISLANIDVRVVMLAEEQLLGITICVGPPLGTGNCSAPGGDSKPPQFFHHPTAVVDSWNGALRFVDSFPDYQHVLRPNSLKYLVMVTDDDGAAFPGIPFPVTCGSTSTTSTPGPRRSTGTPSSTSSSRKPTRPARSARCS